MSTLSGRHIFYIYMAAVAIFVVYGWATYSGPYRWLADWQMEQFGSYNEKLTVLGPLFLLIGIGGVVAHLCGVDIRQRAPVNTGVLSARGTSIIAAIGAAGFLVAALSGWLGYQKTLLPIEFETINLAEKQAPRTNHVRLTGTAQTRLITKLEKNVSGSVTIDTYVPLTAADWRKGDPLTYFLNTNIDAYLPEGGGQVLLLNANTPAFEMVQKGVLLRDALPGPIAEAYRKNGFSLAATPIVLDAKPSADIDIYWMLAVGGALVGVSCLFTGAVLAARRRRVRQA